MEKFKTFIIFICDILLIIYLYLKFRPKHVGDTIIYYVIDYRTIIGLILLAIYLYLKLRPRRIGEIVIPYFNVILFLCRILSISLSTYSLVFRVIREYFYAEQKSITKKPLSKYLIVRLFIVLTFKFLYWCFRMAKNAGY